MTNRLKRLARPQPEAPRADDAPGGADAERELLLELLAQQQRVAQIGLITAGLAHDVDNHIQVISGATFLALRRKNPEDWKLALEKVQFQCCALTEVTRAFLGFVQKQDSVGASTFRVSKVIEEAHRLTRPFAHQRGVTLTHCVEDEGEVAGERRLAIQAIVNLITNAVRACAGGTGRIVLRGSRPLRGTCRLEVCDNGPGIPDNISRRLFRPFATGSPGAGGNGLGLFIVRQNIRRLGGSIRVHSSSDGTAFEIDLPVTG